jgi:phosphonate transport system substrate-binding protein
MTHRPLVADRRPTHRFSGPPLLSLLCVLLILIAPGCGQEPDNQAIDLTDLTPLPADRRQGVESEGVEPLRVAVSNVISPKATVESYGALLDYIAQKMARPVQLVQRRTYSESNELLRLGEVDVAFVCTYAYVVGHREFGMELLAVPRVQGETAYHSALIVPADSPTRSMADLKGAVFAFTDPLSTTGCLYPTHLVQQLGETPESFFARTFYTDSHDAAIRAVVEGVAGGAAVDNLVLGFARARDPQLGERVRVIHRSLSFAMPPAVVGPEMRPQLRARLEEILLGMDDDPEGRSALGELDIEGFALIDDDAYDSVRDLARTVGIGGIGDRGP